MKIQELNSYLVATYKGRILILRRKSGVWEFPGGGVDWGEDPKQAALRELREETALVPIDPSFVCITSATYEKDGNEKHSIYLVYKAEVNSDRVILSGEHSESRWLTKDEIKYMKLGLNAEPVLDYL